MDCNIDSEKMKCNYIKSFDNNNGLQYFEKFGENFKILDNSNLQGKDKKKKKKSEKSIETVSKELSELMNSETIKIQQQFKGSIQKQIIITAESSV